MLTFVSIERPCRSTYGKVALFMKSLGNRLELVSALIHTYGPFACLADIGSDHAFVAVRAMQNKDAAICVASDINEGPLSRGKETAARYGVSPHFVLSDGFDRLGDFTFDCACICGMGGELIADILRRYGKHPDCLLLLQPMTAQDDLRAFLWENGYEITAEHYVCERSKPYAVLCVRYTGKNTAYTYSDLFLGKFRPDTAEYRAYKAKVHAQAQKRRRGLVAKGEDPSCEDELIRYSE